MTIEEAKNTLEIAEENLSCDDCLDYNQMEDCPNDSDCIISTAFHKAIASLEALEEIRQEAIDAIEDGLYIRNSRILDIIDKHMGETE